jgi:hypothetical protein
MFLWGLALERLAKSRFVEFLFGCFRCSFGGREREGFYTLPDIRLLAVFPVLD